MTDPGLIWSYLSQSPLLWLTATLIAYYLGDSIFRATRRQSWANPVLIAVILLAVVLWGTGTSYQTYFEGAQFVHFMLGPATVALGMPLYDNLRRVRKAALPLIAALVAGSVTAVVSVLAIGELWFRGRAAGLCRPYSAGTAAGSAPMRRIATSRNWMPVTTERRTARLPASSSPTGMRVIRAAHPGAASTTWPVSSAGAGM